METTKALISKYLRGECTQAESAQVERFLTNNSHVLSELFPTAEWENVDDSFDVPQKDKLYQLITYRIYQQQRNRTIVKKVLRLAACITFFFGVYYSFTYFQQPSFVKAGTTTVARAEKLLSDTAANLYYINSDNFPLHIRVSDGSIITLYPHSEVRFAEHFDHRPERIIQLKGKAKFQVAKNHTKPFRVISKGLVTSALGTVFLVDEFSSNSTHIDLLEGAIEIRTVNKEQRNVKRIIKQHESLSINHVTSTVLKEIKVNSKAFDRKGYYIQDNNSISIKNLALEDILRNLEQNFNIHLQYDSKVIRNKYFSGNFSTIFESYFAIIQEINYLHNTNITIKQITNFKP